MQIFITITFFFAVLLGYGTYIKESYVEPTYTYVAPESETISVEPTTTTASVENSSPIATKSTAPSAPASTKFSTGQKLSSVGANKVRATPAGTLLGTLASGAVGTVTGGPSVAVLGGVSYIWWKVDFTSGADGWVTESGLHSYVAPTPSSHGLDTTAPTKPSEITATYYKTSLGTAVTLTWRKATDNIGVKGYRIYRDSEDLGTTIDTYFVDPIVSSPATRKYAVTAFDVAGNSSPKTSAPTAVEATTPTPLPPSSSPDPSPTPTTPPSGGVDTAPPSTPTGLSASAISTTQISLSWTAAVDDVAVVGYKIYRAGVELVTSMVTSYVNSGLTPGNLYSYTISALDAAGNESPQSSPVSATTPTTAPTSASCTATTQSNCILSAVSSGGSSGNCTSGYTGSCSYSCSNGTWSQGTNSCAATAGPSACMGITQSHCVLTGVASGASSGSCASGYEGSCSSTCTNGTWGTVSPQCTLIPPAPPASCTSTTKNNCVLSGVASGASSGSCASGYEGSCNSTCTNGTWGTVSPQCTLIPAPSGCGSGGSCTAADVAAHSSTSNCWVYSPSLGKVYNITSFLPSHPSGINDIKQACGNNADSALSGGIGGHIHKSSTKAGNGWLPSVTFVGAYQP